MRFSDPEGKIELQVPLQRDNQQKARYLILLAWISACLQAHAHPAKGHASIMGSRVLALQLCFDPPAAHPPFKTRTVCNVLVQFSAYYRLGSFNGL